MFQAVMEGHASDPPSGRQAVFNLAPSLFHVPVGVTLGVAGQLCHRRGPWCWVVLSWLHCRHASHACVSARVAAICVVWAYIIAVSVCVSL